MHVSPKINATVFSGTHAQVNTHSIATLLTNQEGPGLTFASDLAR